jgi:hypothetical protein
MWSEVTDTLVERVKRDANAASAALEREVAAGNISPTTAARRLLRDA